MKMAGMPQSVTEMWAAAGSTIASLMFLWAILQQYCPYDLRRYLEKLTHRLSAYFYPYIKISVHEFTGDGRLKRSEAYSAVEAYLSVNSSRSAARLKAEMSSKDSNSLVLTMDDHELVPDTFDGVKVRWVASKLANPTQQGLYHPTHQERRYYRLTFHKRHRQLITDAYLPHVVRVGKEIRTRKRQRKLFTNSPNYKWPTYKHTMWSHINFEHPATFETMGLDPAKKKDIIDDLVTFTESRDFYARIGKAWKRGYLLYGPPGTGKSTMIAAMANLLNYDVYDLELTAVKDNTELRKLLIETTSKSIIVIEDIDCSLDLTGQRKKNQKWLSDEEREAKLIEKEMSGGGGGRRDLDPAAAAVAAAAAVGSSRVTLSGLLNFIDGLWSACGGERLIVFTTNYVEKLDPALIRRGRMDKHIELSYCSFEAFKVLARNYLKLEEDGAHPMFATVERLMKEMKITPADVAENLMPKSPLDDADTCLSRLILAMEEAKEAADIEKEVAARKLMEEEKQKKAVDRCIVNGAPENGVAMSPENGVASH